MTTTRHTYAAEFAKLRTLRSTWTTVIGSALLSVLLAYVVASQQVNDWHGMTTAQQADIDPIATSLVGVLFTTVIFGSLAVRSLTGEYTSGMIQLTMSAMPARRSVFLAKAVVIGSIALGTALVANVASFLVGQHIMSSVGASASFGDPGAVRSILLGSIAVSATAVLGVGLGGIVRRTAIGTTLLAVAIIGSQIFAGIAPQRAQKYLPGDAVRATVTGHNTDRTARSHSHPHVRHLRRYRTRGSLAARAPTRHVTPLTDRASHQARHSTRIPARVDAASTRPLNP